MDCFVHSAARLYNFKFFLSRIKFVKGDSHVTIPREMAGNNELWMQCFTCCLTPRAARSNRRNNGGRPHQRLRIDRSMIGVPTNFRHTAHISSGDIDMTIAQLADLQMQMQRKSGFDGDFSAKTY